MGNLYFLTQKIGQRLDSARVGISTFMAGLTAFLRRVIQHTLPINRSLSSLGLLLVFSLLVTTTYAQTYNPATTDTDGDGMVDSVDLDDDNDGILDAVEAPNCYYTATEAAVISQVSTQLANGDGQNIDLPFMHDGVTTSVSANNNIIVANVAVNGTVIYNVTYPTSVELTSMTAYGTSWGSSATGRLEASVDGVNWVSLMSTATTASIVTKVFTVNQNAGYYTYYRLVKVAGTTTPAITTYEISAVVNTSAYIPSGHTKPICTGSDTDGDGIANQLDRDSDGDGCSDAIEGGATFTLANLTPTGALAGAVSSAPATLGVPIIASTGQTIGYSQNSTLNACTDTDSDGIPDIDDLDDDNDGILDTVECVKITSTGDGKVNYKVWNLTEITATGDAFYSSTTMHRNNPVGTLKYGDFPDFTASSPTISGSTAVVFGQSPWVDVPNGGTNPSNGNFAQIEGFMALPCYSTSLQIRTLASGTPASAGTVREDFTTLHLALDAAGNATTNTSDLQRVSYQKVNFSGSIVNSTEYTFANTNSSGKWVAFGDAISDGADFYGALVQWNIDGTGWVNVPASAFSSLSTGLVAGCTCADTDGDGIADYLDLDSDGDGCSDAIEGGAAFTSANLVNSTMAGGSTNVTQNLGTTIGSTAATIGVPTSAGTGQTIGTSKNAAVQDPNCVQPPTVIITTPKNVTITNTNPPISGTATPGSSVTVTGSTGQKCITTAAIPSGTWTCTSMTFTVGPQTVTAITSNSAGISTTAVTNFTVVSAQQIPCTPVLPGIASASAASIQAGSTASFSLSQFSPASAAVTWTIVPSAGVSQASGTGTNTGDITFLIAGNYSIIYNIVNSSVPVGCNLSANSFATARLVVTSPPTLCQTPGPGIATVAPSSAAIPVNGTASVGLTGGTPNTNISWIVIPSTGVSQATGLGANTGTLTFTAAGLYQVVYTIYNAGNGTCLPVQNTAEAMISVGLNPCYPPSPITIVSSVANNTSVSGNAVTFTAVGGFSGAMSWTVTPGAGASPANGTGNVATVNFGQTGGYTITFVSSNAGTPVGCTAPTIVSSSSSHSVVNALLLPVAIPDIENTNVNTPVVGKVVTNDSDPQGLPLTVTTTPTCQPAHGSVTLSASGSYTYTPATNFTGVDGFCYQVCNSAGQCTTTTVGINVLPVPSPAGNNPPVASNDATQTTMGTSVTINVAANDTDPDSNTSGNGQLNNPVILAQPSVGTTSVNPDGTFKYTPPTGFTGVVTFPYSICDKATVPLCATALVTVTILPTSPVGTPLAPVAVDDALLTKVNTPKTGTVAGNDSDPQGLPLTFTTGQPASGTVVMSPNGSYTYTPPTGFVGPTSFTYLACNTANKCDVATVYVLVQPNPNQPPVIIGEPILTTPGKPVTVCLPIVDPETTDTHTASICGQPVSGTISLSVNNATHQLCVTYTPTSTFSGPTTACVSVCDQAGNCTTTIVPIIVVPPSQTATTPQPPVVVVDPIVTTKGTPVTVCMPIVDPNGSDTHTVTVCNTPAKGTATASVNNANHTVCVVFTPNSTSVGQDAICLTVCDQTGLCTTVTVPVTITDPGSLTGTAPRPPLVTPTPIVTTPEKPVVVCTGIVDTPGDTHTASICGQPASGTAQVGINNVTHALCVTYTPGSTAPVNTTMCVQVCDQTGLCTTVILPITVLPANTTAVVLRLKVMLQGALVGSPSPGLMRDDLRSKKFLPLNEPYTAIGGARFTNINGGGGETMPASVTALNVGTGDAVVDWVFVELRDPNNFSLVVATRSAMVQRDGDVVLASDGVSPLSFSGLTGSSFYISVKHRNHLGAMTATAIPLSTTGTVVDFTTMTAPQVWNKVVGAFNYEGWEQTTVSGKQALWAGDANHNGKVKYQGTANDLITIFSEVIAAQAGNANPLYNYDAALGYYFGDVNMDGKVKYQGTSNDTSLVFTNVITNFQTATQMNSAQLYNFDFMLEQLP